jgi:hypothetical protein
MHWILGGAAVYRCDNCFVLNPALAAEVAILGRKRLFQQTVRGWSAEFNFFRIPVRSPRGRELGTTSAQTPPINQ